MITKHERYLEAFPQIPQIASSTIFRQLRTTKKTGTI